jgi:hypothetical protein
MSFLHNYNASFALYISKLVAYHINYYWRDAQIERLAASNPEAIETIILQYGVGIVTHSGLRDAQKDQAYRVFDKYLSKFSAYTDSDFMSGLLEDFAFRGDLKALGVVLDHISEWQVAQMSTSQIDDIFAVVARFVGEPDLGDEVAGTLRNLMETLGHEASGQGLGHAMQFVAQYGDFEALDAILSRAEDHQLQFVDLEELEHFGVQVLSDFSDTKFVSEGGGAIYGMDGNDTLFSTSQESVALYGGEGNDFLYSMSPADSILSGGDGNDLLFSISSADNILIGGDGSDAIFGGSGSDRFVFNQGESGVDSIYHFNVEHGDVLDISDYLSGFDPLQDAIDDFVSLTSLPGRYTLSVDADGKGGAEAVDVAVLYGASAGMTLEQLVDNQNIVL